MVKPASPRSRVQGLISSLRRKIGEALVTRHPGYLLDPAACLLDIDRCQELARHSRLAKPHGEIARWLREALAVWRGDALDGVDAADVMRGVHLQDLHRSQLEVHLDLCNLRGEPVGGVGNALAAFRSYGSTAPAEVARQLADWQARLSG